MRLGVVKTTAERIFFCFLRRWEAATETKPKAAAPVPPQRMAAGLTLFSSPRGKRNGKEMGERLATSGSFILQDGLSFRSLCAARRAKAAPSGRAGAAPGVGYPSAKTKQNIIFVAAKRIFVYENETKIIFCCGAVFGGGVSSPPEASGFLPTVGTSEGAKQRPKGRAKPVERKY